MNKKGATIAFIGKPNVGKSTLFNAILNHKWAIVSNKPQTTRMPSSIVYSYNDYEKLLLVDTPGYHTPRNKLDEILNKGVINSLKIADAIGFIYDPTRKYDQEDETILKIINNTKNNNKFLIINKIDMINNNKFDTIIDQINQHCHFKDIYFISAKNKTNLDQLLLALKKYLTNDIDFNHHYELADEFMVKEIIREKCIFLFKQEIPYGIAIDLYNFKYNQEANLLLIEANIIVEKASQKPILIGKNGNKIKAIGIAARKELLEIYDCKVVLKLFVKVKEDWRNNDYNIKKLGYK